MHYVTQEVSVLYPATDEDWKKEFQLIEKAGRTAYQSMGNITADSYIGFIQHIKSNRHFPVLEFGNMIVQCVTDRGITHELVRHRLCDFVQESTRYCNYSKDKYGNSIAVVEPGGLSDRQAAIFREACHSAETAYLEMIKNGATPQQARAVLPTATKTTIVIKANFVEWFHIFNLRVLGLTGRPHPDMRRLLMPLYEMLRERFPFMWDLGNPG